MRSDADNQDGVERSDQATTPPTRSVPQSINCPLLNRIERPFVGIALGASIGVLLLFTLAVIIPPLGNSQSAFVVGLSATMVIGPLAAFFAWRGTLKGLYLNQDCLAMPGFFRSRRIPWNDIADVRSERGGEPVIYLRSHDAPKNRVVLKRYLYGDVDGVVAVVRDALSKYRTD